MTSLCWGLIILAYALGLYFEKRPRHGLAIVICFFSCLLQLSAYHYGTYQLTEIQLFKWYVEGTFLMYAIIDLLCFTLLILLSFRLLPIILLSSALLHAAGAVFYAVGYLPFFTMYGNVTIILNILMLGILFVGSVGFDMVLECCRSCVDGVYGLCGDKEDYRVENTQYNKDLISFHVKDS